MMESDDVEMINYRPRSDGDGNINGQGGYHHTQQHEVNNSHNNSNNHDDYHHDDNEQMFIPRPIQERIRRQNQLWCASCMSVLLFMALIISLVYKHNEKQNIQFQNQQSYTDEESSGGSIEQGYDNPIMNGNDPFNNIQDEKTITDVENLFDEGKSKNDTITTISSDEQIWLDATVTLQSGPMFEIIDQIEHDSKSFTEGLTYANGVLYESIGLNGKSKLLVLDAFTGKTKESYDMDSKYFGEGLTYMNGKLIQLTYKAKTGFIYDTSDLSAKPSSFTYKTTTGEGWGLTYDEYNDELIVSDGSHYIHFWDPVTMKEKRKVPVKRQSGDDANNINELEFWRNRVIANVWYEDTILVINPITGQVEKEYDFQTLYPLKNRYKQGADVLNGISVSENPDILYITGKNWNRMYRIRLKY